MSRGVAKIQVALNSEPREGAAAVSRRRRRAGGPLGLGVCSLLALALLPGDASAVILDVEANHRQQTRVAEGTATSSQWDSPDEAVDAARELYEQGTLQYALSNYLVALDKFTEAFGVAMTIEDDRVRGRAEQALRINIARAHVKAYDIDRKTEHLRIALDLLDKYIELGAELDHELEADSLKLVATTELERLELEATGTVKKDREKDAQRQKDAAATALLKQKLEALRRDQAAARAELERIKAEEAKKGDSGELTRQEVRAIFAEEAASASTSTKTESQRDEVAQTEEASQTAEEAQTEEAAPEAPAPKEAPVEDSPPPSRPGQSLRMGAYASFGLTAVGLGVMTGGLVMANNANKADATANSGTKLSEVEREGALGNALFYAGVSSAVVFAGVGAALWVMAKKKQRGEVARRVWLAPMASREGLRLSLGGQF